MSRLFCHDVYVTTINYSRSVTCFALVANSVSHLLYLIIKNHIFVTARVGLLTTNVAGTPNTNVLTLKLRSYDVSELEYFWLDCHHFGFPTPVWCYSLWGLLDTIVTGDPENIGFAVETVFLSGLQAEICVLPVWWSPSWISHFRCGVTALY
jgi:hypothetical protein